MTSRDFQQLPFDEKTNHLWDHGVCYGQRLVANRYIMSIFRVNEFYVEARYSRRNNKVDTISVIREVPLWEDYVDRVLQQLCRLT